MKIALISDIHANLIALQTVVADIEAWGADLTIIAGDMINRGPQPRECLDLLQTKQKSSGWLCVRGNHEDYVITQSQPDAPREGAAFELHRASYWTYLQLNQNVASLASMPFQQVISDPQGNTLRVVHASLHGNRDGIYPETSDGELARKIGNTDKVFGVGHTHRPLIRQLNGTLVVNAGSVGLPFDGDTRLSYARLSWLPSRGWQASIKRLTYDLEAAERAFWSSGYIHHAGPLAELVLLELRYAESQLFQWASRYRQAVLSGELNMRQAVDEYISLENLDLLY